MWWNSNGFTLIESLIVLMIFSAYAVSVPLLYDGAYRVIESGKAEKNTEWEIFVIQLRNEMHRASNWKTSEKTLTYSAEGSSDELVTISQYYDKIRRQVNGLGHEVLLQHVETASFSTKGGKVYIHVTFSNNEQEGTVMYPLYKEMP
ncbi:competence type IV pilus minor pilin ComGF [Domibacillus robiginosus]|uniref:competence type IV pilus minor pilin ComGF n=1 Tax=Domibacillus robiginosus TaxID=1071054 RepID=UPI00067DA7F7|nr:competence type IV pilus minor pilin ComGF [Domibacillus robiginosus]